MPSLAQAVNQALVLDLLPPNAAPRPNGLLPLHIPAPPEEANTWLQVTPISDARRHAQHALLPTSPSGGNDSKAEISPCLSPEGKT